MISSVALRGWWLLRRAVHALLVTLALVPQIATYIGALVFAGLAIAAHRVDPKARFGNCWTYAMPRLFDRGGYITFRGVHHNRLFGILPLPHALWMPSLGEVRMTYPKHRREGNWLPWWVMLFRYDVWRADPMHAAASDDSSIPHDWQETHEAANGDTT